MKNCLVVMATAILGLGLGGNALAAEKPLPVNPAYRGLSQDRGRVAIVNAKGEIEW